MSDPTQAERFEIARFGVFEEEVLAGLDFTPEEES